MSKYRLVYPLYGTMMSSPAWPTTIIRDQIWFKDLGHNYSVIDLYKSDTPRALRIDTWLQLLGSWDYIVNLDIHALVVRSMKQQPKLFGHHLPFDQLNFLLSNHYLCPANLQKQILGPSLHIHDQSLQVLHYLFLCTNPIVCEDTSASQSKNRIITQKESVRILNYA